MGKMYNKNISTFLLLFLLLAIGIGYAYLTSNLSINGTTAISGNTWNIHFENLNVTNGSVTAMTPATIAQNQVDITYAISLARPKDFYEFTVDVKNDGSLPGKVSISSLSGVTSAASAVVDYSITYTSGRPVNIGDILNVGAKKTIKVRVFYKDDIQASDLPNSNINLNLTYTLQYIQSDEEETTMESVFLSMINSGYSCMRKYEGYVTDRVGVTESATNVYFDVCNTKRTIIFGGFCWRVIRTTETSGIKMVYYGEADQNGSCESTRSEHKGIVQTNNDSQVLNSSYLYGSSFTYDTSTDKFTLVDTVTATWSDSTYENLLSKFTCKSLSNECTTIYQINSYMSNTEGYATAYVIANTNYASIGKSSFNANDNSLAYAGYMFNNVYINNLSGVISGTNKFGNSFTYDSNTNTYTLSGTTKTISNWSNNYSTVSNTHYTCWNDIGICNKISYLTYAHSTAANYYEFGDGKDINDVINEMLFDDDVNRYNSSIKGIVDAWYAQNLGDYSGYLEKSVFCNSRNISFYGSLNPDGGSVASNDYILRFRNYNSNDLSCPNETDQLSVLNNKAKLVYPVGLVTNEEAYNYGSVLNDRIKTGERWWELSPYDFAVDTFTKVVDANGTFSNYAKTSDANGIRLVITLPASAVLISGTGSEGDPWVVD